MPTSPARSPRLLLTGFEPFGEVARNASADIVAGVAAAIRPEHGYAVAASEVLPVVYDVARERLAAAIDRHSPDIVVCCGVHRDESFRLETTARNRDSARSADNAGAVRDAGGPIDPAAPDTIATSLPLEAMAQAMQPRLPVRVWLSDDAGGYLCNHVFFAAMQWAASAATDARIAGFVHVPPLRDPDAGPVGLPACIAGMMAALPAIRDAWHAKRQSAERSA